MERTGGFGAVPPDWYAQRSTTASCGVDAEYTVEYPNKEARACFREAYEDGVPAELTRVTYGDEGESQRAHFRVLGTGSYEVVAELTPGPAHSEWVAGSSDEGWQRWRCDRFVFLHEPGYEVDGAPVLNAEGECELIPSVQG